MALVLVVDDGEGSNESGGPAGTRGEDSGQSGARPDRTPPAVVRTVEQVAEESGGRDGVGTADDVSIPISEDLDDDLSAFDESQFGEVADVDNSAQARILQAFPGAEEVS